MLLSIPNTHYTLIFANCYIIGLVVFYLTDLLQNSFDYDDSQAGCNCSFSDKAIIS